MGGKKQEKRLFYALKNGGKGLAQWHKIEIILL